MASFTDQFNRSWSIRVTLNTVATVNEKCGVKLTELFENKSELLKSLLNDLEKFAGVIWTICETQAAAVGVTKEQFYDGLLGDSIEKAIDALLETVIDFFPDARRRDLLRAMVAKGKEIESLSTAKAAQKLANLDAESLLTSSAFVTNSPAS